MRRQGFKSFEKQIWLDLIRRDFPEPIQIRTTTQHSTTCCFRIHWNSTYVLGARDKALATAHVLQSWMFPHLLQKRVDGPFVLSSNDRVMELTAEATKFLVVVCTKDGRHQHPGVLQCFSVWISLNIHEYYWISFCPCHYPMYPPHRLHFGPRTACKIPPWSTGSFKVIILHCTAAFFRSLLMKSFMFQAQWVTFTSWLKVHMFPRKLRVYWITSWWSESCSHKLHRVSQLATQAKQRWTLLLVSDVPLILFLNLAFVTDVSCIDINSAIICVWDTLALGYLGIILERCSSQEIQGTSNCRQALRVRKSTDASIIRRSFQQLLRSHETSWIQVLFRLGPTMYGNRIGWSGGRRNGFWYAQCDGWAYGWADFLEMFRHPSILHSPIVRLFRKRPCCRNPGRTTNYRGWSLVEMAEYQNCWLWLLVISCYLHSWWLRQALLLPLPEGLLMCCRHFFASVFGYIFCVLFVALVCCSELWFIVPVSFRMSRRWILVVTLAKKTCVKRPTGSFQLESLGWSWSGEFLWRSLVILYRCLIVAYWLGIMKVCKAVLELTRLDMCSLAPVFKVPVRSPLRKQLPESRHDLSAMVKRCCIVLRIQMFFKASVGTSAFHRFLSLVFALGRCPGCINEFCAGDALPQNSVFHTLLPRGYTSSKVWGANKIHHAKQIKAIFFRRSRFLYVVLRSQALTRRAKSLTQIPGHEFFGRTSGSSGPIPVSCGMLNPDATENV